MRGAMPSRVRCSHSLASRALTRRTHHAHARTHTCASSPSHFTLPAVAAMGCARDELEGTSTVSKLRKHVDDFRKASMEEHTK